MSDKDSNTIPLQMVIIDLEDGQRGIFFGSPFVAKTKDEDADPIDCVQFSAVEELPQTLSIHQLASLMSNRIHQSKQPIQ